MKYEIMNAGTVMAMYKILMKLVEWQFEKKKQMKSRNDLHIAVTTGIK